MADFLNSPVNCLGRERTASDSGPILQARSWRIVLSVKCVEQLPFRLCTSAALNPGMRNPDARAPTRRMTDWGSGALHYLWKLAAK